MPLPLPNLDDRRWADLVDEGRALIPRYAPQWTDHNVSDPGITLLDLLAWVVEADLYRVNRVTDRHRRKFLALVGLTPAPPSPARVTVSLASRTATRRELPRGTVLWAHQPGVAAALPFRVEADLTVTGLAVAAVQVAAAADAASTQAVADRTAELNAGNAVAAWGADPRADDPASTAGPALLLGFESGGAMTPGDELSIALELAGSDDPDRLRDQMARAEVDPRIHHGCRAVWESYDGADWLELPSPGVTDQTRSLTVSGAARLRLPAAWPAVVLGTVPAPLHWLRCRLAAGRPDTPPLLRAVACDAVVVAQAVSGWSTLRVGTDVDLPDGAPVVGTRGRARIALDPLGRVAGFAQPRPNGVSCTVLGWRPPSGLVEGELTVDLLHGGPFEGEPNESVVLPGGPLLSAGVRLTTTDAAGGGRTVWSAAPDLDAATRRTASYTFDAATATLRFGDGDHGRLPTRGDHGWVAASQSSWSAGTPSPLASWELAARDPHNAAVLPGADLGLLAADLAVTVLPGSVRPGTDAGDIEDAEGAAAEDLWAHERLLEIGVGSPPSLDQVPPAVVLGRAVPPRATTLLDFERIARAVPGTAVARARAWSSLDVGHPCLSAPGTVTVVVVPSLPAARPEPTQGLLRTVRAFLVERRVLGTRLLVVGPQYVEVTVDVRVACRSGAVRPRVAADVVAALSGFLHPLTGGPAGLGWPFGRDVARSELLQVVDSVAGVDYVDRLQLGSLTPGCPESPGGCGNVVVAPTMLVTSGPHRVEVT